MRGARGFVFQQRQHFLASKDCDMLEVMYVRCAQCGYDNSPEYRFCGMCGGPLPQPATVTKPPFREVAPPVTISGPASPPTSIQTPPPFHVESAPLKVNRNDIVRGPSFLGLSEESTGDYLDEEEPKRSRAGMIVIVLLLLVAGGYIGWQWRHNGFPFDRLTANIPAAPTPASSANADQSPEGQAAKPSDTTASPASDTQSATSTPDNSAAPAASGGEQTSAPAATHPATTTEKAEAAPPERPHKAVAKLAPTRAAVAPAVEKPAVAGVPDADLEAAGERYLYGTGLPQNCARAESSLRTAATHGNSKAQTVLGTMYATGHCVGRDLPTAYRWFARALHEDPQNSRISDDLQVLWRQMTPGEKQLATAKQ